MPVYLDRDTLAFHAEDVHPHARFTLEFQRTLRIPDDGRDYPLPPGFGRFPLRHVEDHAARLPDSWVARGGVMLPMYQAEAMWIAFSGSGYPFAVKIAAGKINAITGEAWSQTLDGAPQDYVVLPKQPWLDGFCVGKGLVRQFVAMPLGAGYSAEEQLTGLAEHGGIQIVVYPAERQVYERLQAKRAKRSRLFACYRDTAMDMAEPAAVSMALAPGGLMRQQIYDDPHGLSAWDQSQSSRCFVHLLNSAQWQAVTGKPTPTKPPTAQDYTKAGLPWFSYYDESARALGGSRKLAGLDSVAAKGVKKGEKPLPENDPVKPKRVFSLWRRRSEVSEGEW